MKMKNENENFHSVHSVARAANCDRLLAKGGSSPGFWPIYKWIMGSGGEAPRKIYVTTPFSPSESMGNALYILHVSFQLQHSLKYTHIFLLRVESLLHSPIQSHYEVDEDHLLDQQS